MLRRLLILVVLYVTNGVTAGSPFLEAAETISLNLRQRIEVAPNSKHWNAITKPANWEPKQTAIIVCDMWDKHWCPNSTARVAEMAPRMNEVIKAARSRGVTIIHCPSDTMDFYKDTPQRKRAQAAPAAETKRPLERWCKVDPDREPPLPIDDTDGGCDCDQPVENRRVWSRQIPTIEIHADDAVTDSDEAYRLMRGRGITNAIVMGVHTNICVLGRPFSIRQLAYQGMNVVLMRDLTDTMYNPAKAPYVSHFTGNDLVVEHIEKYWCPTITSSDFVNEKPFRFKEDIRPHVVMLIGDDEYKTETTLPVFAATQLGKDFKTTIVFETPSETKTRHNLPGIDVVDEADIVLLSLRRRILPTEQLAHVKRHVAAGKPIVGIRIASHAFSLRSQKPDAGLDDWPEIDRDVIGGSYRGHTGNNTKALIRPLPGVSHPILNGIPNQEHSSGGTLYLNAPLAAKATELMRGRVEGMEEQHPGAWIFERQDGGRTFYTSAGHPDDFDQVWFKRLLFNGLFWAAGREVPPASRQLAAADDQRPDAAGQKEWKAVAVPGLENHKGSAWYRCEVSIPQNWTGRGSFLYVEKVKGACESFVNGVKVGVSGAMPPKYADGVENIHRYVIPDNTLKPGEVNSIAIRIHSPEGAGGFTGQAPQVLAGNDAISLSGRWLFRAGDDAKGSDPSAVNSKQYGLQAFSQVTPATQVSRFATVIRREAQQSALTPQQSMDHFKVPDDLQVDLVLSEPIVSQPLFMNFDERGRLWVLQYLQYPEPEGLTLLSKDQWWRAVYDKVPDPPPHGVKGKDKISIHEDTDGDGVYDKHKTFVDDLNISTAFVQGRGGLWVLNPPYLLFYPDKNGDDVPDGDPEVHLSGFGIEDTHSVVNSLRWGPDGWLYGAQGSTVSGAVTLGPPNPKIAKDGKSTVPVVHSLGQNIWRYHPEKKRYEIFSEGGGNAFGLEIDSAGRIFSGHNGGNTRGFHYMQGAYLQKGFTKHGPLSNPYSFGYFPAIEHHDVPRFTHEFLIYQGADGPRSLPSKYRGQLFGAAAILSHVVISDVQQVGSTFKTKDAGYAIDSSDSWFRPVDIVDGPDGAIYVADWYDGQLAHTANYQGGLDRENGRIYRIRGKQAGQQKPSTNCLPLAELTSNELISILSSPDRWHRETARRLLADRKDASLAPTLKSRLFESTGQTAVELLWVLYLSGGLDDGTALKAIDHADPQVRLWTVRLLADENQVPSDIAAHIARVAAKEPNIEVRSQFAASAKRLPTEQALPIIRNLMLHDEDVSESRQPLMIWWALEANIDPASRVRLELRPDSKATSTPAVASTQSTESPSAVLRLFDDTTLWTRPLVQKEILPRLMRRFAATGQRADLAICAKLLRQSPNAETTKALISGFEEAFQGRSLNNVPQELVTALSAAGGGSLSLKIRQADSQAIDEAIKIISDEKASASKRAEYVAVFGEVKQPKVIPVLLEVLAKTADDGLKAQILTSLQTYGDPAIATAVLAQYSNFNEEVRGAAQSLLVSRKPWSISFVNAVEQGRIAANTIPADTVRRMTIHTDDRLAQSIQKLWGNVDGATTADMQSQIDQYAEVLVGSGDPYPGKKIYMQMCGKCHTLHAVGGKIGPDLTTYKRDNIRQMLVHIVNPSAEIREGFETQIAVLKDGRVVTGFVAERDSQTVTLRSPEGQTISLELADLEMLEKSRKSLMPEGQLKELTDEQLRNLFAYLRSSQPLAD